MKRTLLLLFAALSGVAVQAQSLPNGDFESWATKTYNSPDSGWYTSNIQSLSADDSLTVWKVAGLAGQAIHIQTAILGSDTLKAYISTTAADPTKGIGGMPYSQKPTALTGFYRCNIVTGDTGGVIVVFKKSGAIIAPPAIIHFTGSTSTFTAFSLPISLSVTPDTIIIAATSSNLLNNSIGLRSGSWLELDELLFTGTGITQGILNGGFETWVVSTLDMPGGWRTQSHGTLSTGITKTTDHYSGSYAIKLQTLDEGGGQIDPTQITSGKLGNNGPYGGLPYTQTTDTLTGYYKYTTTGTDTGQLQVTLMKNGAMVGGQNFHFTPTSSWTYFQLPFSASTTPDTIHVDIVSSSWNAPVNGSTLYIDKLQLKSQPLNVNTLNNGTDLVSVYPNPVSDVLNIDLQHHFGGTIELRIMDLSGKELFIQNYSTNDKITVPVNHLAAGMYLYQIRNNGFVIRNKFIKE